MKAWRRYAPVSVVLLYLCSLLVIYSEVGHQARGTSSRRGRRSGSESDMQAMQGYKHILLWTKFFKDPTYKLQ